MNALTTQRTAGRDFHGGGPRRPPWGKTPLDMAGEVAWVEQQTEKLSIGAMIYRRAEMEEAGQRRKRKREGGGSVATRWKQFLATQLQQEEEEEEGELEEQQDLILDFPKCWEVHEGIRGHMIQTFSDLSMKASPDGYVIANQQPLHRLVINAKKDQQVDGECMHACHRRCCSNPLHILIIHKTEKNYNKFQLYIIHMFQTLSKENCSMFYMEVFKEYLLYEYGLKNPHTKMPLHFEINRVPRWEVVKPIVTFGLIMFCSKLNQQTMVQKIDEFKKAVQQYQQHYTFFGKKIKATHPDNFYFGMVIVPKLIKMLETMLTLTL
jgi:hypothetical protein